jgi:hypothetical protein
MLINFIQENIDLTLENWGFLSDNKNIRESFVKQNIDKVDWEKLSRHISFIEKHIDKIDFSVIMYNPNITESFFDKYESEIFKKITVLWILYMDHL